jgi:histidine ammonia-lyase
LITLTGNALTIKEVEKVLYGYEEICLDETSLKKVDASRQVVKTSWPRKIGLRHYNGFWQIQRCIN